MYLPATELQQYRGQLACPYCIQDLRDEDRKMTETTEKRPRLEVLRYPETCDRCGRDLEGRVYIWNGKRLCKRCLEDEQDTWGLARGGPMGPAQRIKVDTVRRGERKSFIERSIGEFLALIGLKRKPISEIIIYHPKMTREIGAAKPMAETAMAGALVMSGYASGVGEQGTALIGKCIKSLQDNKDFYSNIASVDLVSTKSDKVDKQDVMSFRITCLFK